MSEAMVVTHASLLGGQGPPPCLAPRSTGGVNGLMLGSVCSCAWHMVGTQHTLVVILLILVALLPSSPVPQGPILDQTYGVWKCFLIKVKQGNRWILGPSRAN